jgi:CRP-like cAMP-binding protein
VSATLSPEASKLLVDENERLRLWLTLNSEDRLVEYLSQLPVVSVEPSGESKILRPPSQEQMGADIGVYRETVNRALSALRADGFWRPGKVEGEHRRPTTMLIAPKLYERAARIRGER